MDHRRAEEDTMNTSVIAFIGALGLAAGTAVLTFAADKAPLSEPSITGSGQTQGFRIVQGEVLKMEGNTYLVRDETGQEVRLTVNKDSKITTAFEVGDRIVAQVSDQGVVTLINKSEAGPQTGTQPSAPAQKR
jgi:hypothetical protein